MFCFVLLGGFIFSVWAPSSIIVALTFSSSTHPSPAVLPRCAATNKAEMAFKEKQTHQRLLMQLAQTPSSPSLKHPPSPSCQTNERDSSCRWRSTMKENISWSPPARFNRRTTDSCVCRLLRAENEVEKSCAKLTCTSKSHNESETEVPAEALPPAGLFTWYSPKEKRRVVVVLKFWFTFVFLMTKSCKHEVTWPEPATCPACQHHILSRSGVKRTK